MHIQQNRTASAAQYKMRVLRAGLCVALTNLVVKGVMKCLKKGNRGCEYCFRYFSKVKLGFIFKSVKSAI
jgi:hypothetical protein